MQPILSKTSGSRKDTIKVHYHPGPALESTPSSICLLSFTLSILYKIGPPLCSNDGPHQEFRYFQWTISSPVDIITPLNCSLFPNLIPPFFFSNQISNANNKLTRKKRNCTVVWVQNIRLALFPRRNSVVLHIAMNNSGILSTISFKFRFSSFCCHQHN